MRKSFSRNLRKYLGPFLLVALSVPFAEAQNRGESIRPVGVFGTGHILHSELLAPMGAIDGNYIYISCPDNYCVEGQAPFVTLNNQYPFPLWLADTDNGQWIGPDAGGNENMTDPSGEYEYRQIFDLTGFDLKTVNVYGAFACDNSCYLALNGAATLITNDSYATLKPFWIHGLFKPGLNRIDFFVYNQVQSVDNPTGLFVEMYGEGEHAKE